MITSRRGYSKVGFGLKESVGFVAETKGAGGVGSELWMNNIDNNIVSSLKMSDFCQIEEFLL